MQTQSDSRSLLSNSMNSNRSMKYGGLVHRTFYKYVRDYLSELINYIYTVVPALRMLHTVITLFRITQLFGPSIAPSNELWTEDKVLDKTTSIISIFFHILPPEVRDVGCIYFNIIYIAISIAVGVLIIGSAFFFNKYAKLPNAISYFIVIYIASFNFLLHPIAIDFAFEMLAKIIFRGFYNFSMAVTVIVIVLTVLCCLFFEWMNIIIINQTLAFRSTSFPSLMPVIQNYFFAGILIVTALLGFSANATLETRLVFIAISTVLYLMIGVLPFYRGGFISNSMNALVSTAGICGAIISIIFIAFISIEKYMNFTILVIMIVMVVGVFIIANIIYMRRSTIHLMILDRFLESNDLTHIKSVNHFINVIVSGMRNAHASCVDWSVFKAAVDKWPRNSDILFVFAKFVSIYPEDTNTLGLIFNIAMTSKLKGITSRTLKSQTLSISRQREANLSPNLKIKINTIQKRIQSAKHKMRAVWDLAIQGNIGEMESTVKRAYVELDKNDAEFKHLFRQFPNNRFVTRAYARFCKELLANQTMFVDFLEKSKLLQRGIAINLDLTHELGMKAFPMLPNKVNAAAQENPNMSTDVFNSSTMIDDCEDEVTQDDNQVAHLRETIVDLTIPAIRKVRIMRLFMIVFLFFIPMVILFVYSSIFITNLTDPLQYFKSISDIRQKLSMVGYLNYHYVYEQLGVYNPVYRQQTIPTKLGGEWDTREMVEYSSAIASAVIQDVTDFNGYQSTNPNIVTAQSLMFGNTLNYSYFVNPHERQDVNQTIQAGVVQIINEVSETLNLQKIEPPIVNTSKLLNPMNNLEEMGNVISSVLDLLINFITDNYVATQKMWNIIMIVCIILLVIIFVSALIYQLVTIQYNKEEAYKCLSALPKNVVSSLVENLRVLKKDDNESSTGTDTETNKQEDNILKTFMTGGSAGFKIGDRLWLIFGTMVTIIVETVMFILFCELLPYESNRLLISAPHLNYLNAAFTQMMAAHYYLQMLSTRWANNVSIPLTKMFSDKDLENYFNAKLDSARYYYQAARFGGPTIEEAPFQGFQAGLTYAYSLIECKDPVAIPDNFMDMVACYNVEGLYILCEGMLMKYYQKQMGHNSFVLRPNNINLDYIWSLLISPIYEGLYNPMFETIIPTIREELATKKSQQYVILIVLLVIGSLFEITAFVQLSSIEKHIKQTLMLLLHAPATVLLNVPKITAILGGDFTRMKGDNTKRSAEFYDTLFKNMPDAVVIVNMVTHTIEQVNKSCTRLFFSSEEDLIGQSINEFFQSKKFKGDTDALLRAHGIETNSVRINEVDPDGSIVNLEMSLLQVSGKQVIMVRDITNVIRYNKLIQDERAKSDALLASILPATLVKRVQAGEKNISFAVQSATILFLDIVSFTPWCGSSEATKVMMTLNLMFKKLDQEMSKYSTMTKIKCIGDCYMAAGGIFSEVNQPAEHAKEVTFFGLDALDCMTQLNEELNEKLQIRVGVNTGGPIVAGVLGIGKPTFEILGPAINMAQQMEHHGVPMAVHISRPVYELIYGDTFKIKERGNIEVKNGSVVTYIVQARK